MEKGTKIVFGILAIIILLGGFAIFYKNSGLKAYGVACLDALNYRAGNTPIVFDRIPIDSVTQDASGTLRYKLPQGDAVAKAICLQGHTPDPADAKAFYESVVNSPDYGSLLITPVNYEIVPLYN